MSSCVEMIVAERLPIDQAHRDRIRHERQANQFVEAGAGSGKTRALVDRVEALVVDDGIALDSIAAITFSEKAAAEITLAFLAEWVPAGTSPMCGNSICQDRRFMARHMPELETFFHYRNLDVSTLKILMQRWRPDIPAAPKKGAHQALEDIRESIEELRHYRAHFLRVDADTSAQ